MDRDHSSEEEEEYRADLRPKFKLFFTKFLEKEEKLPNYTGFFEFSGQTTVLNHSIQWLGQLVQPINLKLY